jgi:hypothetical protein
LSKLKAPLASVNVVSTRSPCVARTVAPGIGCPLDLIVPLWANAAVPVRSNIAAHAAKPNAPRIRSLSNDLLIKIQSNTVFVGFLAHLYT